MAEVNKPKPGPFDVSTVRELVELMAKFDLSEIDLNDGEQRLRLRKGGRIVAAAVPMTVATPMPMPMPAPTATVAAAPTPTAPSKKLLEIKSELVGSFYTKPAQDKEPFVKIGSKVTPDTTVCTVEAMKIFNATTAKCSGTIAEICVKDGEFVEFDQVLFRVDPS